MMCVLTTLLEVENSQDWNFLQWRPICQNQLLWLCCLFLQPYICGVYMLKPTLKLNLFNLFYLTNSHNTQGWTFPYHSLFQTSHWGDKRWVSGTSVGQIKSTTKREWLTDSQPSYQLHVMKQTRGHFRFLDNCQINLYIKSKKKRVSLLITVHSELSDRCQGHPVTPVQ